jgi:hypothetical protein
MRNRRICKYKKNAGDKTLLLKYMDFKAIICLLIIAYIIGRCTHPIGDDKNKLCSHEIHIHLKPNRSYIKKIRNKCDHVEKADGKRLKDLKNIVFKK